MGQTAGPDPRYVVLLVAPEPQALTPRSNWGLNRTHSSFPVWEDHQCFVWICFRIMS